MMLGWCAIKPRGLQSDLATACERRCHGAAGGSTAVAAPTKRRDRICRVAVKFTGRYCSFHDTARETTPGCNEKMAVLIPIKRQL